MIYMRTEDIEVMRTDRHTETYQALHENRLIFPMGSDVRYQVSERFEELRILRFIVEAENGEVDIVKDPHENFRHNPKKLRECYRNVDSKIRRKFTKTMSREARTLLARALKVK